MADAASSLEKQALERKEKLKALKAKKTEKKEDSEKEAEEYVNGCTLSNLCHSL